MIVFKQENTRPFVEIGIIFHQFGIEQPGHQITNKDVVVGQFIVPVVRDPTFTFPDKDSNLFQRVAHVRKLASERRERNGVILFPENVTPHRTANPPRVSRTVQAIVGRVFIEFDTNRGVPLSSLEDSGGFASSPQGVLLYPQNGRVERASRGIHRETSHHL